MRWKEWEEHEYAAWMRMAKWTARTSGCKRGPLSFSTRDLALKRSKNNRLWTFRFSVRLWHLCCGAADWPLIFHDFVDGCASSDAECDENIEGTSIFLRPCSRWSWISVGTVEDSPRHCLPLWWKAECQAQRLKVVHLIQIFGHCTLEKYSKIHWVGEYDPRTF